MRRIIDVSSRERREIKNLCVIASRQAKKRADLLATESNRSVPLRRQSRHVVRCGKGVVGGAQGAESRAAGRREPIEQLRPASSDNCWQAKALTKASKIVGKRGGFTPRNLSASSRRRASPAAVRYQSVRSIRSPRTRSSSRRRRCLSASFEAVGSRSRRGEAPSAAPFGGLRAQSGARSAPPPVDTSCHPSGRRDSARGGAAPTP